MSRFLHPRAVPGFFFFIWLFPLLARAEPAMWVIKSKHAKVYLLGTLHILRPETVWDLAKIKNALGDSRELWLELVLDRSVAALTTNVKEYEFDQAKPLTSKLTSEQYERLSNVAGKYTFPMELMNQMKPWYAAVTMELMPMLKAGYNPNAGVEVVLEIQARLQRKRVAGFETMQQQLQFLDTLPEADQVAFLMETIDDVDEGVAYLEKMEKAWSEGDLDSLEKSLVDEMKNASPSLYQTLILNRNVTWSEKIATMLQGSGTRFVAVGAAHLIGPDSVQAQLAKRGFKAKRY